MGIVENVALFAADPAKMLFTVSSLLLAVFLLTLWKKYDKPVLLYSHLMFVLTPLFYFALSINCSMSVVKGFLGFCTALFAKFMIYLVPPLMAAVFIGGVVLLPRVYRKLAKPISLRQFDALCKSTGIKADLFIMDKAKPVAFALGKSVFVSIGMFDILSKKEIEAVLLHELHHIRSRSSWVKFSTAFARVFSPIAWFSACSVEKEERAADAFAVEQQGTRMFLQSAKQKVEEFH